MSYDMIDRFLRNNLGDDDYAEYSAALDELVAPPKQDVPETNFGNMAEPDYAWPTIEAYEKEVGFKVNDAFKAAWSMARTTNDLFKQMGETK
jgi:hypothetical protein